MSTAKSFPPACDQSIARSMLFSKTALPPENWPVVPLALDRVAPGGFMSPTTLIPVSVHDHRTASMPPGMGFAKKPTTVSPEMLDAVDHLHLSEFSKVLEPDSKSQ